MSGGNAWDDLQVMESDTMGHVGKVYNPLVTVCCYNDFKELAHRPRGQQSEHLLYTYQLDLRDGSLTLLSVTDGVGTKNPAFVRGHPDKPLLYVCTETLGENGKILSYETSPSGKLTLVGSVDAEGTSTCYLTVDKNSKHLIAVNYWNSSVVSFPINKQTGLIETSTSVYHPNGGTGGSMQVQVGQHVNHSLNDENAKRQRQLDPHTHAVVIDPYYGCIAYVPDLGMDVMHELYYNPESGVLTRIGEISVGATGVSHGPRYIEFHPTLPVCYVVNEISSVVAVFQVAVETIAEISSHGGLTPSCEKAGLRYHTLKPLQQLSTIPDAFSSELNTCSRITVHPSGLYVVVSNRGHNSLAVFRIQVRNKGKLRLVGLFHTRGQTPRHFQFDKTGQWLIVANQDTNTLVVFNFNVSDGSLSFTNNVYSLSSPNFVCCHYEPCV
mmetsp:Transcript_30111/g.47907  ORF Transcript_30111/g.47907 Transcript_30111/m.47907 type:complete len:439 (-) Transcript_30111:48-1364(-)